MLKTGSEHLFTSAQLICYTKQNYLFLHKPGSAATFSLASAVERRKKKKEKRCSCTILSHPPPQPNKPVHMFHLALFWATTACWEDNPRCLPKTTSSKKKVCGSDYSVVLKPEEGEGVCTHSGFGGRCCIPKSRCVLECSPLLPNGAGAAVWFQFSMLHL